MSVYPSGIQNGGDLADTAIRALEGGALSYNGNPSKSTLIIHSVQRVRNTEFIDINENLCKLLKWIYLKESCKFCLFIATR